MEYVCNNMLYFIIQLEHCITQSRFYQELNFVGLLEDSSNFEFLNFCLCERRNIFSDLFVIFRYILDPMVSQYRRLAKHQSISLHRQFLSNSLFESSKRSEFVLRHPRTDASKPSKPLCSFIQIHELAGSTIPRIIPPKFSSESASPLTIHIRELDSAVSVTSGPFVPWTPVISFRLQRMTTFVSSSLRQHEFARRGKARSKEEKKKRRIRRRKKRERGR